MELWSLLFGIFFMELFRLKDDVSFVESENIKISSKEEKVMCAMLDHVDKSITESLSDKVKEGEDLSQDNENSLDKSARRPVETWKYLPFQSDCNRMSYKCSLCCSVYQHKKSLNKHWKDKHLANLPSSSNSVPFQERIPSNIINVEYKQLPNNQNIIYSSENNVQEMVPIKRESINPQVKTGEPYQGINRKRLSLHIVECEQNKENYPLTQSKRLSLLPMQSLMFRQNRSFGETKKLDIPSLSIVQERVSEKVQQFILRTNNNIPDSNKPGTSKQPFSEVILQKVVEPTQPEIGALDLRISKFSNNSASLINFRCFQCVFHTNNIVELNEHFKHLHVSILLGIKSFCLPMSIYQKLLLNQFTAIVRTESEPLDIFNGPLTCFLCNFQLQSRYDMIQHVGIIHEMEMIWVCLVCGFGCRFPAQLSHHFRSHSDIHMWTKSMINVEPTPAVSSGNFPREICLPKPESHLAASTPNNKPKRIISKKDHSNSDQNNSKEKPLKCLVCDATARWRSELFTHMITHSEHRSFGCKFCCYRSKWKWDVPKHLKRCRLAPPSVRKPDIPNSYLITLLQHYSPPPGDILYEFMKQYNIKDLGSLNRPLDIKLEAEENIENEQPSTSNVPINVSEVRDDKDLVKIEYEAMSSDSEEDVDLDVGTDPFFEESTQKCEQSLKCLFKKCPWCNGFLTNKPSEMSAHLADHHGDVEPFKG